MNLGGSSVHIPIFFLRCDSGLGWVGAGNRDKGLFRGQGSNEKGKVGPRRAAHLQLLNTAISTFVLGAAVFLKPPVLPAPLPLWATGHGFRCCVLPVYIGAAVAQGPHRRQALSRIVCAKSAPGQLWRIVLSHGRVKGAFGCCLLLCIVAAAFDS